MHEQEHSYIHNELLGLISLERPGSQAKDDSGWKWDDINFCKNNHPLFRALFRAFVRWCWRTKIRLLRQNLRRYETWPYYLWYIIVLQKKRTLYGLSAHHPIFATISIWGSERAPTQGKYYTNAHFPTSIRMWWDWFTHTTSFKLPPAQWFTLVQGA